MTKRTLALRTLALRTLAFITGCIAASSLQAQESNMAFKDGCSRQSPEQMRPSVILKLNELEAALSRDDLEKARTAQAEAEGAATDVAGWTGALALKCLNDQPIYRRYFVDAQELWRLQARVNPEDVASRVRAALWVSIKDGGGDAGNILAALPDNYRNYGIARDYLKRAADTVAYHRDLGAFVISEETATEKQARRAVDLIDTHARQRSSEALASEAEAFYRDPNELEKDGARTLEDMGELAGAMAGVEINATEQNEYQFARQRIYESRQRLEEARGWEFGAEPGVTPSAAYQRAAERGDEVMAWAGNDALSFTTRDAYYERALAYYGWCQCKDQAGRATAAREAIQPQLLAEQASRQEQIDQAEERLKGQAEDMQRALDDMQKTDAEKKAFEDEADELEAELGF